MFDSLTIQSHSGPYIVEFNENLLSEFEQIHDDGAFYIVDDLVFEHYNEYLSDFIKPENSVLLNATEETKSINQIVPVLEQLISLNLKRNNTLVAIGGGIIQDITCFVATVLFRGIQWNFVPTTLLSQADSCIGSKSSVNLPSLKNALGTFKPPQKIWICPEFLNTLNPLEIKSGIGEIIKVHAIDDKESFDLLAKDFQKLETDRHLLLKYIHESLRIKKRYIEIDEFDKNERNIFNYGHSFGHAIEAATNFGIPHGIAISMGMDMANTVSSARGLTPESERDRMRPILRGNYQQSSTIPIPFGPFLEALKKDKKNTKTELVLILPCGADAEIKKVAVPVDDDFVNQCVNFFLQLNNDK